MLCGARKCLCSLGQLLNSGSHWGGQRHSRGNRCLQAPKRLSSGVQGVVARGGTLQGVGCLLQGIRGSSGAEMRVCCGGCWQVPCLRGRLAAEGVEHCIER